MRPSTPQHLLPPANTNGNNNNNNNPQNTSSNNNIPRSRKSSTNKISPDPISEDISLPTVNTTNLPSIASGQNGNNPISPKYELGSVKEKTSRFQWFASTGSGTASPNTIPKLSPTQQQPQQQPPPSTFLQTLEPITSSSKPTKMALPDPKKIPSIGVSLTHNAASTIPRTSSREDMRPSPSTIDHSTTSPQLPHSPNAPSLDSKTIKFTDFVTLLQAERKKYHHLQKEKDDLQHQFEALRSTNNQLSTQLANDKAMMDQLSKAFVTSAGVGKGNSVGGAGSNLVVVDQGRVQGLERELKDLKAKHEELTKEHHKVLRLVPNLDDLEKCVTGDGKVVMDHLPTAFKEKWIAMQDTNKRLTTELDDLRSSKKAGGYAELLDSKKVMEAAMEVLRTDLKKEKVAHKRAVDELNRTQKALEVEKTRGSIAGSALDLFNMANSTRHSGISSTQVKELVSELRILRLFKQKYGELTKTIETATNNRKMCLVTAHGCVVTTLAEMKKEFGRMDEQRLEFEKKIPLPKGWERIVDPRGRYYYINHDQKQTSWIHPAIQQNPQLAKDFTPSTDHISDNYGSLQSIASTTSSASSSYQFGVSSFFNRVFGGMFKGGKQPPPNTTTQKSNAKSKEEQNHQQTINIPSPENFTPTNTDKSAANSEELPTVLPSSPFLDAIGSFQISHPNDNEHDNDDRPEFEIKVETRQQQPVNTVSR